MVFLISPNVIKKKLIKSYKKKEFFLLNDIFVKFNSIPKLKISIFIIKIKLYIDIAISKLYTTNLIILKKKKLNFFSVNSKKTRT